MTNALVLAWILGVVFFLGYVVLDEVSLIGRHANPPPFRSRGFYWDCLMAIIWPVTLPLSYIVRTYRRRKYNVKPTDEAT